MLVQVAVWFLHNGFYQPKRLFLAEAIAREWRIAGGGT
jgi:hypothetical protein